MSLDRKSNGKRVMGILSIIFLTISVISLSIIYYNDRILFDGREITFTDENNDVLFGTYYEGNLNAGIIILAGFGGSQTSMKSITSEFAQKGFYVFTFDFSGHSRSSGAIFMDNPQTDRYAKQLQLAIEQFKTLSGLTNDRIILLGHSMGGRVAMQSQTMNENNISAVIFIGGQIDLNPNPMSQFFTGINDSEIEWIKNLNENNPEANVLIITGEYDDVLPPASAQLLIDKIGGISTGPRVRELVIIDKLTHTFEIFNVQAVSTALNFGIKILGLEPNPQYVAITTNLRNVLWVLSILSMMLSIVLFSILIVPQYNFIQAPIPVNINAIKPYYIRKLIYWLPSLAFGMGILMVFFIIPLGFPIFGTPFAAIYGGYGLFMIWRYSKGKVKGIDGKLQPILHNYDRLFNKNLLLTIGIGGGIILYLTLFLNSGFFYAFPLNERFGWLLITTPIAGIGFFSIQKDRDILNGSKFAQPKNSFIISMIDHIIVVVLILSAIFGGPTTASGVIQYVMILLLVILSGELFRKTTNNRIFIAFLQGFLLQYFSLAFGPIFQFF